MMQRFNLCPSEPSMLGGWVDVIWLLAFAAGGRFSVSQGIFHGNGMMFPPTEVYPSIDWTYPLLDTEPAR